MKSGLITSSGIKGDSLGKADLGYYIQKPGFSKKPGFLTPLLPTPYSLLPTPHSHQDLGLAQEFSINKFRKTGNKSSQGIPFCTHLPK